MDADAVKETRSAIAQGWNLLWPAAAMARAPYWIAHLWPNTMPLLKLAVPLAFWLAVLACVGFALKRRGIDALRFGLIAIGALVAAASVMSAG